MGRNRKTSIYPISGLFQSEALLLLYLVRCRRGRNLLSNGGRDRIRRMLLYITEASTHCWAAEESKEFCKAISWIGHK